MVQCEKIKVIHLINRLQKKNSRIISINAEKPFDKTQDYHDKNSQKRIAEEGDSFNLIKNIYKNSTANMILIVKDGMFSL